MPGRALIIHGGSGNMELTDDLARERYHSQESRLREIIDEAWVVLLEGGSAVTAVERAVNLLENDPSFNAGIGAALGRDGQVELDASLMDGADRRCGAVAALKGVPNAISVARLVMERLPHVFIVGPAATDFARENGFEVLPDEALYTEFQLSRWRKQRPAPDEHGTVGAVARDINGKIAAATSTGGLKGKMPGRVGDSAIIGAGTYADSRFGGASCTGSGEHIIRAVVAKAAVDHIRLQGCAAMEAARRAIVELSEIRGGGAVIMVDSHGRVGYHGNERHLPRAWRTDEMEVAEVRMAADTPEMLV